jgi:hypothetical protein
MVDYILHPTPCTNTTTMASARIALFLKQIYPSSVIIDSKESFDALYSKGGKVMAVNGPFAFCQFREQFYEAVNSASIAVWVQNDYAIDIPSRLRGNIRLIMTVTKDLTKLDNFVYKKKNGFHKDVETYSINWNKLSSFEYEPIQVKFPETLFYYGAFREGREEYFRKYFSKAPYKVSISASSKAILKFQNLFPFHYNVTPFKPLTSMKQIGLFGYTIYLEDKDSHEEIPFPANRFYECLSAGIAIMFDSSVVNTFAASGIDVSPFVVDSQADVTKFMKRHRRDIVVKQKKLWPVSKNKFDLTREVINKISEIM